jgi:hypothetical protein
MNRRSFLGGLLTGGALGVIGGAKVAARDPRVPPRMDVREGDNPAVPIEILRNGEVIRHVVAYDLDGDWATVLRTDPKGTPLFGVPKFEYETLRGGIIVRWTA